jgi:triacylglycerol lipase
MRAIDLRRMTVTMATAIVGLALAAPGARAETPDTGASLTESRQALQRALECRGALRRAERMPVLLVHGTGSSPLESFSFGYAHALAGLGFPVCTVRLPGNGLVDMQRSIQYVVHAIREAARISQRKVSLIGHSQGALLATYAPYFWPDLPAKVDDVIGLAGPHRGTTGADAACAGGTCPVFTWQFRTRSKLGAAFRDKPRPTGPSFTAIATAFDELVLPGPQAARLNGASNVVIQDLCPARPVEHFGLVADAVAYALALDALTHRGAANPSRFNPATCLQALIPGADLAQAAVIAPRAIANAIARFAAAPVVGREPMLRCPFDVGDCPTPQVRLTRRCTSAGHLRIALAGDVEAVRDVDFKLDRRRIRRDVSEPFAGIVDARVLRRARRARLRAVVHLDRPRGTRLILARSLPRCGA